MTVRSEVTFSCDQCGMEYMLDYDMNSPPNWIGVQLMLANPDGIVSEPDRDLFFHICSPACMREFAISEKFADALSLGLARLSSDEVEGEDDMDLEVS